MANLLNNSRLKHFTDLRNIGLYLFVLFVLAMTWSGIKTLQTNYELQKQISVLRQENVVLNLQNQNTQLQTQYFETDQYLELAARENFGLAAPGEKVILIPKETALKYIDPKSVPQTVAATDLESQESQGISKNLQDWRDFLLGRRLSQN
ncbi:MAG: septum formation initiator family protein [Candidatus Saccharimonadales bacterium]